MYAITREGRPRRGTRSRPRLGLAVALASGSVAAAPAAAATNTIVTVAGNGTQGFSGDGGLATSAQHRQSHDVAVTPDGGFVFTDFGDHRVRRVSPAGIITTVAGSGQVGTGGRRRPRDLREVLGSDRRGGHR